MDPKNTPQKSNMLIWIILLILLLLMCAGGYFIYKTVMGGADTTTTEQDSTTEDETEDTADEENVDEDDEDIEEETPHEGQEVEEDCVQATAPAPWVAVEMPAVGYTAYRPGWYYRIFGTLLGIDPNPIPVNSEYAGMITIRKHSGTQAAAIAEYTGGLEAGFTETEIVAGCRTWVVIEGTIPASEISDAKQVKTAFTTEDGKVIAVHYETSSAIFATHEAKLDTLIDIMVFAP